MLESYNGYCDLETALSNMFALTIMAGKVKKRRLERGEQRAIVQPKPKPPKQGRNEPCNCYSGKKYKCCCGR